MKKTWQLLIGIVLLLTLLGGTAAVQAKADWTVLLYMCGTDLESKYGNASSYLAEVVETRPNASVNLVVETGGALAWHSQEALGFQISNTTLQRYQFDENGYTRVGELPSVSMGDPNTLTEFIRWGTVNYPAEKYMLVLWDHGDGLKMLYDEVYQDMMQSYEIGEAMRAAGTQFEVFVVDACLMSTLEIASAVAPNAHYMIASQETTVGLDAAFTEWMQYLYDVPEVDGALFGHYVCDTTQWKISYNYSGNTLTWAVTDLTKIDAVKAAFADFVKEMAALLSDVKKYRAFNNATTETFNYGSETPMYDLENFAKRAKGNGISSETVIKLTNAIMKAIVYQVKGGSRIFSYGLSFFYNRDATPAELDEYAKNCPVPEYLAFLDAIYPNWEYENSSISFGELDPAQYNIESTVSSGDNGEHLQLNITNGKDAVLSVSYDLYKYFEESGKLLFFGTEADDSNGYQSGIFTDHWDGTWYGYDGTVFDMEQAEKASYARWYNVPVIPYNSPEDYSPDASITKDNIYYLRVMNGVNSHREEYYMIDGIWNGQSLLENNTFSLAYMSGNYLSMLWKWVDINDKDWPHRTGTAFSWSRPIEITDDFSIQRVNLADGIYYIVYSIEDVFGRRTLSEPAIAEIRNGKLTFSCPGEVPSTGNRTQEKSMPLTYDHLYLYQ